MTIKLIPLNEFATPPVFEMRERVTSLPLSRGLEPRLGEDGRVAQTSGGRHRCPSFLAQGFRYLPARHIGVGVGSVVAPGGDALKSRRQRRVEKKSSEGDADLRRRAGRGAAFCGRCKRRVEQDRLSRLKRNPRLVDEPLIDVARDVAGIGRGSTGPRPEQLAFHRPCRTRKDHQAAALSCGRFPLPCSQAECISRASP